MMSASIIKYVTAFSLLGLCLSRQCSNNYKSAARPLLESADVGGLQQFFKETMNDGSSCKRIYQVLPIDYTVLPDVTAIKMLISLSLPQLDLMGTADLWPANNNIDYHTLGAATYFDPKTSYHGGIRYIYNCVTLTAQSIVDRFNYYPSKPIFKRNNEEIYVVRENLVAANGDAIDRHIQIYQDYKAVVGFTRMTLKECNARQVFYNGTDPNDCVDSLNFFSLPEEVVVRSEREGASEYASNSLYVAKQFFLVFSG